MLVWKGFGHVLQIVFVVLATTMTLPLTLGCWLTDPVTLHNWLG